MRVAIADDSLLVREGIAALLRRAGCEIVAEAASGEELVRAVDEHRPEVAVVDVRMPPTQTDEGVRAALEIRARHPGTGIVILSQEVEAGVAMRLLAETPAGLGYLLKDRVSELDDLAGTLRRVADGGSALDPAVVRALLTLRGDARLDGLSAREHEVLASVAEGLSNKAIGERLMITPDAVRKHVTSIFGKLDLPAGEDAHRRILAVLAYLAER
ncbi:MAG: response regulator transcription factor [Solirubrobacteraceae bacterium]